MKVLVLNCGSSSVKFQVIETSLEMIEANADLTLARGAVEKIGLSDSRLSLDVPDRKPYQEIAEILEHRAAIERQLKVLVNPEYGVLGNVAEIEAVGHRVVHGGEKFASSVLVNPEVEAMIEECVVLAPLHNPHNLRGLTAARSLLPGVPHIAVFDTAFHQSMPPKAFVYGLPYELYTRQAIRRYGFHGTSHRFVSIRTANLLRRPIEDLRIVTCHLGNGCSMAAVDRGHSVDTSMGFTPLEGLLMGTRCGDLDAAIVPWVLAMEEVTLAQLNAMLNKHSGLPGARHLLLPDPEVRRGVRGGHGRPRRRDLHRRHRRELTPHPCDHAGGDGLLRDRTGRGRQPQCSARQGGPRVASRHARGRGGHPDERGTRHRPRHRPRPRGRHAVVRGRWHRRSSLRAQPPPPDRPVHGCSPSTAWRPLALPLG